MASINATTSSGIVATADNTGTLQLQTAGTNALNIDASQNVGIGTTSPFSAAGYKSLTINGSTSGLLALQNNGTNQIYLYSDGSAFNFKGLQNIPLDFYTNDTYRMRIDSSGNLAIGTSSALGKMSLYWNNATQQGFTLQASTTTFNGSPILFYNSSGGLSGFVGQTATTISYNTSSDYRLKDNIALMTGALDTITKLKPVTYNWKVDGSKGQGFIAHELQEIIPDCVTGEKDAVNEDGSIKPQGIDTSFLVATLTAAIQEQQTIINDLKARIETLEGAK